MAILFVDGFDSYSSTNGSDFTTRWDSVDRGNNGIGFLSTAGRFGGGAFYANDGTFSDHIRKNNLTAGTPAHVGIAFWFRTQGNKPSDTVVVIRLGNSSGWADLSVSSAGKISGTYFDNSAHVNQFTAELDVCDGNWHWIEYRMQAGSAGSGAVEVYIDGAQYVNQTGVTTITGTSDGGVDYVQIFSDSDLSAADLYIDDFIMYDANAGATGELRADVDYPLGPMQIETLRPNSTGANNDFTAAVGSTTTNYLNVDETAPDGNTSYNTSTAYGDVDTYGFGNISSTYVDSIKALAINIHARRDGVDTFYGRAVTVSSASTGNLDPVELSGAFAFSQKYSIYDPATSTFWTTAGVDAAEFGYATSSST